MNPTINRPFVKRVFVAHTLITAVGAVIIGLLGHAPNWGDFAIGAALSGGNLLLILLGIRHALMKKSFALTAIASVFKYGFLILLFWFAAQMGKKIGYEFIVGVMLILPTTGYVAYELSKTMKNKIEN